MQNELQNTRENARLEDTPTQSALLGVVEVARHLSCSPRHVYRLSDAGMMPRPRKLGALVRWSRVEIEKWISDGCPSQRKGCK